MKEAGDAETQWHNACAPGTKYDPRVQQQEGELLAVAMPISSGITGAWP